MTRNQMVNKIYKLLEDNLDGNDDSYLKTVHLLMDMIEKEGMLHQRGDELEEPPIYHYFTVGEKVFDDLTNSFATVIRIDTEKDAKGYWVDNDHLGGGRHPWELTRWFKYE